MFFSIIIPIFNAENSLRKCLDSVCAQSYIDYEVILIDDGSTDNSALIYNNYVEKDLRFHSYYQANRGVSAARNYGLELCKGEFIFFLDSDDCYKPNYLQSFFDLIQTNPDGDHFWCGYVYISNDSELDGNEIKIDSNKRIIKNSRENIMSLHENQLMASPCNKAYRRSIIDAYRIRMTEELSLGEDLLFNLEYLDKSSNQTIIIINTALYEYRCFSNNSLNHRYRSNLDVINNTLSNSFLLYLKKWNLSSEQFAKYYSMRYYMLVNEMLNTYHPEDNKSFSQKIRYNNRILKSRDFKEATKLCSCSIHPLYRVAFFIGDYRFVYALDKLSAWKRNIKRK